ncbi:MAG: ATP-dependent zinc metalloprotease FtsH [Pedobacter sp.]|nr:MAG: ATP-dependent zinc metalloprotease FtsH [Pedobacter sp.]
MSKETWLSFLSLISLEPGRPLIFLVFTFLSLISNFLIIPDKLLSIGEQIWEDIEEHFFNPNEEESSNSFFGFLSFEESETDGGTKISVITETGVCFSDVAGNEEAKEEVQEIVKFLKEPGHFSKLGAIVPRGVLLSGPPGTGKTLLARAIANEAGVPFLKIAGSQFVELAAGVGAARVHEIFEAARSIKPSILFIDEIDSIAGARSGNEIMGGENDEREQTLNQILTEMDGFDTKNGIIVIAATNRLDILDPAITRPGRFDRQIVLSNPNYSERQAILKVHARDKKLDSSVSIPEIAQRTTGFSGADLANILNEAAILAARKNGGQISMDEIYLSLDRLLNGLEKKQLSRTKARQLNGLHQIGYAILASLVNETETIEKVTLLPRGQNQANTVTYPSSIQYESRDVFIRKMIVALGGRAAEESIYGQAESTEVAQDDILEITENLRDMISRYAMTRLEELKQPSQEQNLELLGNDAKEEITNAMDHFTTNFIEVTYEEVLNFFRAIRPGKERAVDELLTFEELSGGEVRALIQEYLSAVKKNELLTMIRESFFFNVCAPDES